MWRGLYHLLLTVSEQLEFWDLFTLKPFSVVNKLHILCKNETDSFCWRIVLKLKTASSTSMGPPRRDDRGPAVWNIGPSLAPPNPSVPQQPPTFMNPLRLFAQAVDLKTTHSVWMFFSQAGAAGYMFAFPPLSKTTFTSAAEEKGPSRMEVCDGQLSFKWAVLVCAGRRLSSWCLCVCMSLIRFFHASSVDVTDPAADTRLLKIN